MGTRLGRYDIIRTLAKGELTDLLLACADGMEGFQRHVAIKRLHASHAKDGPCLEAFVNEARLAAALHHHNIVQVLDIGQEGGQPYFAMEYVHGVDLRALLNKLSKRGEQMPLQHVVSIVAAAAAALHHAHEQRGPDGNPLGIVHRDVTPANILVGYDGNIKVVDFGIAKAAIKRIKTDQGVLKGRVPYMAPEQCAGKPVDRRSDVFALGIVAYELATVRRLFKGASEFLTMSAIVNGDIPKPSQYRRDVPAELEQIMMKALARDPAARYQSAGEMALALDEVALAVGVGASTTQLANYMKLQFGEQKEPWLLEAVEEDPETTAVDFDGGASGLAPPPADAVKNNAIPKSIAATRSSPIAQVRNNITPAAAKKSVPLDKSYSMSTDVEASSYDRQSRRESTESDHVPTVPATRTSVASPPPPPTHAGSPTDATEIVVPLPVMPTERPVVRRRTEPRISLVSLGGSSKGRVLIVAAAFAVVVIVAGAIVLWPGSDVPASAAPDKTAQVEARREERKPEQPAAEQRAVQQAEPQKAEPSKTEEAKTDTPSGLNATMADYDKAREDQAAAEKAASDKAAADADKQAAADKAAQDKQAAAQDAAAKKQAAIEEAAAKKQAAAEEAAAKKQAAADKAAGDKADKQAAADKATADKQAKMPATKRPAKPAATKTVKRPAPKPAAKKSTKKGTKWNPDELFLGD